MSKITTNRMNYFRLRVGSVIECKLFRKVATQGLTGNKRLTTTVARAPTEITAFFGV
jgi:hypothetical protein